MHFKGFFFLNVQKHFEQSHRCEHVLLQNFIRIREFHACLALYKLCNIVTRQHHNPKTDHRKQNHLL